MENEILAIEEIDPYLYTSREILLMCSKRSLCVTRASDLFPPTL
jgi:hypothetical protein